MQNKILNLFNEEFVANLFKEKLLSFYPDFSEIKKIKIIPHKKLIWENTYHVVVEFELSLLTKEGRVAVLPIFATAHSNEPRRNVYDALKFLWDNDFSKGYLTIPHPLFYSEEFRATFYRGAEGTNLYQYIRNKDFANIESVVIKAAAWFAKLHRIPTEKARNFNEENSRVATVIPGVEHILKVIKKEFPEYYGVFEKAYKIIEEKEEKFLADTSRRWLVHGDAHPENVIKMGKKKIAVIDFTDLCLSDFARDIGTFLQQLEYMCNRKIQDSGYAEKIKDIFLSSYLKNAKIKMNDALKDRIDNYYNWTTMRTATFFLLKDKPEPERAKALLEQVVKNLDIK